MDSSRWTLLRVPRTAVTEVLVLEGRSALVCTVLDLNIFCFKRKCNGVSLCLCLCLMTAADIYNTLCSMCKGITLSLWHKTRLHYVRFDSLRGANLPTCSTCSPRHMAAKVKSRAMKRITIIELWMHLWCSTEGVLSFHSFKR